MGLVWRICEPDQLLAETRRHAELLASRPIPSLVAVKQAIAEPARREIAAARSREDGYFAELMGAQANAAALEEFKAAGARRVNDGFEVAATAATVDPGTAGGRDLLAFCTAGDGLDHCFVGGAGAQAHVHRRSFSRTLRPRI